MSNIYYEGLDEGRLDKFENILQKIYDNLNE